MLFFIGIILTLSILIYIYTQQPSFGAIPKNEHLEQIRKSPNYKDGQFQNLIKKPELTESVPSIIWTRLTKTFPNLTPMDTLPSIKTNLKQLNHDNVFIWLGHSSFFLQLDSVKILVDPVFSGSASPLPNSVKAFKGSDIYTVEDLPEIDYLLLSHDHYDHLDYKTTQLIKSKVKYVVTGLGNASHYKRWGYLSHQIHELDWGDSLTVRPDFIIHAEDTHHFSGRGLARGKSLWLSFYIQTPNLNIYYSGDGGYSNRFEKIAKKYPPIDWAIMECGQYNEAWHYVHQFPSDVIKATSELKAKNMVSVHHSKFVLSSHPWHQPLEELLLQSQVNSFRFVTPLIGQLVDLQDDQQIFSHWWKDIK